MRWWKLIPNEVAPYAVVSEEITRGSGGGAWTKAESAEGRECE
jgi:hypothetical protein